MVQTAAAPGRRISVTTKVMHQMAGLICLACASQLLASPAPAQHILWFERPAQDWEREGQPIGNSALGALVLGDPTLDRLQFNEKTLWTGGPGAAGYDYGLPDQSQTQTQAQAQLTQQGALVSEAAAEPLGRKTNAYGNYQSFGELQLAFELPNNRTLTLHRQLDGLTVSGQLPDNSLHYAAQLKIQTERGSVHAGAKGVQVKNANSATLVLFAGTDYAGTYHHYRGEDPQPRVKATTDSTLARGLDELLLQSPSGQLSLLTALPDAWRDGSVRGLRARGGVTMDMHWRDGQLQQASIVSDQAGELTLNLPMNGARYELRRARDNKLLDLRANGKHIVFAARVGEAYLLGLVEPTQKQGLALQPDKAGITMS